MALAGVPTQRNLVIASVQSGGSTSPVFQESDIPPYTRPNGGDLVKGDFWYSSENNFLYMWDGVSWGVIGGEGIYELVQNLTERLEVLESYIGNGIADGGNAWIFDDFSTAPMEGS